MSEITHRALLPIDETVRPALAAIRAGGDPPKLLPDHTGGARG